MTSTVAGAVQPENESPVVRLAWAVGTLTCIVFAAPVAATARGEASYRLAETREPVPASARAVRTPVWSQPYDRDASAFGSGALLADGSGAVAFASGGRMCSFSEDDGRRLWCAEPGHGPAYAGGAVAYVLGGGGVLAVDARTGRTLWRRAGPRFVWPSRDGFLVARYDRDSFTTAIAEANRAGHTVWSGRYGGGNSEAPFVAPPFAFARTITSGATLVATEYVFRVGAGGGYDTAIVGAWALLSTDASSAIVQTVGVGEMQDHFLSLNVVVVDLRTGRYTARYYYEPDYDANLSAYDQLITPGSSGGKNAVDGQTLYMTIGPRLYRYHLGPPKGQRPLLISSLGTYIGGPYAGALYVSRPDGVWALRPGDRSVQMQLVAPSAAPFNTIAIVGRTAYIAFANGELRGVDVADGRTTLEAKSCVTGNIGIGRKRIFVTCVSGPLRVVAFPRPDVP